MGAIFNRTLSQTEWSKVWRIVRCMRRPTPKDLERMEHDLLWAALSLSDRLRSELALGRMYRPRAIVRRVP